MIKSAGYTPRMEVVSVQPEPATGEMSDILGLKENAILICVRKLFFINDNPAIFTEEWLPESLMKEAVNESDYSLTIFDFLEKFCDCQIAYGLSNIISINCDERLAKLLALEPGDAITQLRSTYYSDNNQPIDCANAYYNNQNIQLSVLRRREL